MSMAVAAGEQRAQAPESRFGFWRRSYAMVVKEFIQLRRDRVSFAMIVMLPASARPIISTRSNMRVFPAARQRHVAPASIMASTFFSRAGRPAKTSSRESDGKSRRLSSLPLGGRQRNPPTLIVSVPTLRCWSDSSPAW